MTEPIDMLERDERAADAKALLDNPLLQEVFQRMEAAATERLLSAEPGTIVAVAHHQRIMAIRSLHAELISMVEDPKTLRAAAERRRRFSQ
jgi:hypothetical protein